MLLPIDSRTGIPMTALHTEKALEDEICRDLAAADWLHDAADAARYDRALALFPDDVVGWIQTTQPEAWASIEQTHGANTRKVVCERLRRTLADHGTLHVLRHGFEMLFNGPIGQAPRHKLARSIRIGIRRAVGHIQIGDIFRVDRVRIGRCEDGHAAGIGKRRHGREDLSAAFVGIHLVDQPPLFQVVDATRTAGGFPGACEGGQQDGGQDPDDGNDYQEFDECEPVPAHEPILLLQVAEYYDLNLRNTLADAPRKCKPLTGRKPGEHDSCRRGR